MYSERFSLGFVSGVLMAAAERRRPGLGAWSPQVREQLRAAFADELATVKRSFFELFTDSAYWERLEKAVWDELFPRYAAIAERQSGLEQRDYGLWRGGDLIARLTYGGVGLVVGALCVKIPWIPIPESWDLFAFATMLAGPFIPDAQIWWLQRRHRRSLEALMAEMAAGERAQELYQPLGMGQLEQRASPVSEVASSEGAAGLRERSKETH